MTKIFFTDWQLWEKLVFVLGCCVVLTVIGGVSKLAYASWRVRKYSTLEKLAAKTTILREKSIIRSLSKKSKTVPRRKNRVVGRSRPFPIVHPDVLFGIKALRSGKAIDGVWKASNNASDDARHIPAEDLEAQGTIERHHRAHASNDKGYPKDRGTQTSERQPSVMSPNRSKFPPHSFMRYATFSEQDRQARRSRSSRRRRSVEAYTDQSSATSADSHRTTHEHSPASIEESGRSARDTNRPPMSLSVPASRDTSANSIQLIDAHRASLGVETGQILPRFRSTSIPDVARQPHRLSTYTDCEEPTLVNSESSFDEFESRMFDTPAIHITNSSPPRNRPPVLQSLNEQLIQGDTTGAQSAIVDQDQKDFATASVSPSFALLPDSREIHVLRHVNSGFAILRPGTLATTSRPTTGDVATLDSQMTLTAETEPARRSGSSKRSLTAWQVLDRSDSKRTADTDHSAPRGRKLQKRRVSAGSQSV